MGSENGNYRWNPVFMGMTRLLNSFVFIRGLMLAAWRSFFARPKNEPKKGTQYRLASKIQVNLWRGRKLATLKHSTTLSTN